MWRRKKDQMKPGGVEVYANYDQGLVYFTVTPADGDGDACVFALSPEYAFELAQRTSLAAIMVQEGPDADL